MPARLTSQWVTMRSANFPVALARIWRFSSAAESSAALRPVAETSKITMLVWTLARSTRTPGSCDESLGEVARVGVIFVEPGGRFFERYQSRGRQYAGLAHSAAETLARGARLVDEFVGAQQQRSDRRTQTFRQAKHHGIEFAGQFGDAAAQRYRGIEDARAVQVHR